MRTLFRRTRHRSTSLLAVPCKMIRLFLDRCLRVCRSLRRKPWFSIICGISGFLITRSLLWRKGDGNDRSVTQGTSGTSEEESGCREVRVDPAIKSHATRSQEDQISRSSASTINKQEPDNINGFNNQSDQSAAVGESGTPEEESGCREVRVDPRVDPADKSCVTRSQEDQISRSSASTINKQELDNNYGKESDLSAAVGESATPEKDEFQSREYRVDPSDELYCGYDSTWETDPHPTPTKRRRNAGSSQHKQFKFSRFTNAAKDMQNYRHDYPQNAAYSWQQQSHDDKPNLKFYLGEEPCLPDGLYINDIHKFWWGNYSKLESVHTYIQWLFPLQELGMNYQASTLTKAEIQDFCQNDLAKRNLLKSYKLMLDFYGIQLKDEQTGAVKRSANWEERYDNLNCRTHNNLRITRILKCLGTLGYQLYQAPLVHFFLEETLIHGKLPSVKESVLNYFLFAVLNKKERRKLIKFAYTNYTPKEEFVWCPKKIQQVWSRTVDEAAAGVASDHDVEARNHEQDELTGKNNEDSYEEFV